MTRYISIIQVDGVKQELTDERLPLVIGSNQDADIILPGAEPIAAYVGDSEGYLFIQPADALTAPLFHNNRILNESKWLKSNDTIQIGTCIISYQKKGDQLQFSVAEQPQDLSSQQALKPPMDPPPSTNGAPSTSIPVNISSNKARTRTRKLSIAALGLIFVLLSCAVLFVLFARPLTLTIDPRPDSISIKGFPPPIKLGERFLCLPGSYRVTLLKKGYHPFEQTILIHGDRNNSISATLEKLPGRLTLSVNPAGTTEVHVNGTLMASTPPDTIELPPGDHEITLIKPRFKPFQTRLTIEGEGKTQVLTASLEPDWAEVTITSIPPAATLTINGQKYGTTPLTIELLSGEHELILAKEQYQESAMKLLVVAGEDITREVQLELQPALLSLESSPEAAVSADSLYQGVTPLTIKLTPRSDVLVELSAPDHKGFQRLLNLAPGEKKKLSVSLEQEKGTIFLSTQPPSASVIINGKQYGNHQGKLLLPVTKQVFEVRAPGYKPTTRTILPKVGFSQQLVIELAPLDTPGQFPSPSSEEPTFKTSAGQRLLLVKPEPFTMGAPRREPGRRANERQRTVIMKRSYYLAEKLVTNREFRLFAAGHRSGSFSGFSLDDDNQPVVNLSWEDAVRYLNWLSKKDELTPFYIPSGNSFIPSNPPANGYRLPTEAEWAFAARQLGNTSALRFPWGEGFPPRSISGNFGDSSAVSILPRILQGYNDGFAVSSPIGTFAPNKGGFYDMGGNVSEWCHDYYSAASATLSNKADPLGPASGTHRVIRGSSWRDAAITELRLSYRSYHRQPRDTVGFRIARYR